MNVAGLNLNCCLPFLVGSASHSVYVLRIDVVMNHSSCTPLHFVHELEQSAPQSRPGDPGDCRDQPTIVVVITMLYYKTNWWSLFQARFS